MLNRAGNVLDVLSKKEREYDLRLQAKNVAEATSPKNTKEAVAAKICDRTTAIKDARRYVP